MIILSYIYILFLFLQRLNISLLILSRKQHVAFELKVNKSLLGELQYDLHMRNIVRK